MSPRHPCRHVRYRWFAILMGAGILVALVRLNHSESGRTGARREPLAARQSHETNAQAASTATNSLRAITPVADTSEASPNSPTRPNRPLPVASESLNFQWTAADAKHTNVIRQLAHNDSEYQRMIEENDRIKRRQLVYNKIPAAALLQRSRLSGEPVRQLILPGFDGQEFPFAIERADLEPSQQIGTFTGHLAGRPGSLVTVAFKFGREAFTILSPEDGTFLQGHPRDSGEIILTSFDPDTYQPLPEEAPIKTTQ